MAVTDTRRHQILEALIARLQQIRRENGYATDAGLKLAVGELLIVGEDDAETAIVLVVEDDNPSPGGPGFLIELPVEIQAVALMPADRSLEAWQVSERVVGDIKRAIEQADRKLAGLLYDNLERGTTRLLSREPGSPAVGIGVRYLLPYKEAWGDP